MVSHPFTKFFICDNCTLSTDNDKWIIEASVVWFMAINTIAAVNVRQNIVFVNYFHLIHIILEFMSDNGFSDLLIH